MVSNSSSAKINEIVCGSHLVKVNTSNASKVHLDDVEFSLEKEFLTRLVLLIIYLLIKKNSL